MGERARSHDQEPQRPAVEREPREAECIAETAALGAALLAITAFIFLHSPTEARDRAFQMHYLIFPIAGVGMSQGDVRQVFEPYFRATPCAGEGSGLGLFIARSVMNRRRAWRRARSSWRFPVEGTTLYDQKRTRWTTHRRVGCFFGRTSWSGPAAHHRRRDRWRRELQTVATRRSRPTSRA